MNNSKQYSLPIVILTILITTTLAGVYLYQQFINQSNSSPTFDGVRSLNDVSRQLSFGPRIAGSQAHRDTVAWIEAELNSADWVVEIQETPYTLVSDAATATTQIRNIVAKRGEGSPWIILGAHYDSRQWADHDPNPDLHKTPVPGANDGASGVAVLLELARTLPKNLDKQIWLVFFDAEDNGNIPGWDWILGSRQFAASLEGIPDAVIIVDMIGDADLNVYMERNSNAALTQEIWQTAASLGYDQFIPTYKFSMLDDHTPFLEKGISAVDIIDFDYPYWHTTADTLDKVSAESLDAIGDTLLAWVMR